MRSKYLDTIVLWVYYIVVFERRYSHCSMQIFFDAFFLMSLQNRNLFFVDSFNVISCINQLFVNRLKILCWLTLRKFYIFCPVNTLSYPLQCFSFCKHIIYKMFIKKRPQRSRQKEVLRGFTFTNREQDYPQRKKVQKSKSQQKNELSNVAGSNQLNQYFSFRIQDVVQESDPTNAWQYNIPILSPNQRQIFLVVEQFQIVLVDYVSDQFPHSISIGLRTYSGYKDKNGMATNKIMCLQLVGAQTTQMTGYTQRDLIYKSQMQTAWNLGSLKNLVFEVYVDDSTTPVNLPLSNPLNVTFKILHVVY